MPQDRPLPDDVVKITPYLTEEALLIIYGGLPVDEIKSSIRHRWANINQPGAATGKTIDETVDQLRAGMEIIQTGGAVGMYVGLNRIRDVYQYTTIPALHTAKEAVGGYQKALMDAVQTQAQIEQHYGMIGAAALPGVVNIGRFIVSGRALEALRGLREAETAADIGRLARRVIFGVRMAETASTAGEIAGAAAGGAAGAATAETGPGAFWTAIAVRAAVEAVIQGALSIAGNKIARSIADGYAHRMAAQSFAQNLFDRQRVIDEFNQYAGVLGNYMGSQFNGNNGYSILDRVRATKQLGLSPADLGMDYKQMNQVLRGLIPNTELSFGQMKNYASMIASMSAVYGVNTDQFMPIMTNLAMTTFSEKDVNQATHEFEKFFMSLVGNGKPQIAQLTLVKQLTDFARNYGMGQKFNANAPDNLANIQQFMTKNVLDGRQSVIPTEHGVMNIDQALQQGAIGSNPRAADLLRTSGISTEAAMRGVTASSETFNKFLGGIIRMTGIGVNSYDKNNNLNEQKATQLYLYANKNLGLDNQTIQALIPALQAYAKGERATTVRTDFLHTMEMNRSEAIGHSSFYSVLQTISDGNVALSKSIADSMPVFLKLDKVIFQLYTNIMPNAVGDVGNFAETTGQILDSSNASASSVDNMQAPTYTAPQTHQDFIREAVKAAVAAGVPNVPVAVAQAALESRYGQSALSKEGFNFFGMKAHPGQQALSLPTQEYTPSGSSYTTQADFAKYSSPAESFKAYAQLIKGARWYRDAVAAGGDINKYIAGLMPQYKFGRVVEPGYATDPHYKEKLMAVINQYNLQDYQQYMDTGNQSNNVLQYDSLPLDITVNLGVYDPGQFVTHITSALEGSH